MIEAADLAELAARGPMFHQRNRERILASRRAEA